MLPIVNIGPLAIQLPGLVILLGLWLGLTLAERNAPRFGVKANELYNLVFIALIAGIIGARLAYVLRYPQAFAGNPLSILSLNISLLDPWGGLTLGLVATLVYGQRKSMPFWSTLDALTPVLAVFAIAVSLSQFASGAAFGAPTEVPWSIHLWGADRHPTQIYEALAGGLILIILWPSRIDITKKPSGSYFLTFIALSAGAHLFLEAFRGDSILLLGVLRQRQVIAWLVLAASLWGLFRLQQKSSEEQTPEAVR
jgi:prolipoprotein diacylglyceryl transferase